MTLIERLRIAATDDHERGCQGRYFACTCGYDAATQIACHDAAHALEAADALADQLDWYRSTYHILVGAGVTEVLAAYRAAIKETRS